jgi:hypothetical protein
MTVVRTPRPIGLPIRVYMQNDPRDFAPVGAVRMGIEHAEICDEVLFVVPREHRIRRREIGAIGIEGWLSKQALLDIYRRRTRLESLSRLSWGYVPAIFSRMKSTSTCFNRARASSSSAAFMLASIMKCIAVER